MTPAFRVRPFRNEAVLNVHRQWCWQLGGLDGEMASSTQVSGQHGACIKNALQNPMRWHLDSKEAWGTPSQQDLVYLPGLYTCLFFLFSFSFIFILFFIFFWSFLGLHLQHMEVPRLGVK